MAMHAKEKKRLKRERLKESRRRKGTESISRHDRLAGHYWGALDALRTGNYKGAAKRAIAFLQEQPRDREVWSMALESARRLNDRDLHLSLAVWQWREGLIPNWKDWFSLGQFALDRKDYEVAKEIFEATLNHPMLATRSPKRNPVRQIREHLEYTQAMLWGSNSKSESPAGASGTKSAQILPPGGDQAPSMAPIRQVGPEGVSAAVQVPEEPKTEPVQPLPPEPLPDVMVRYETTADLVIDAVRNLRQADRRSFELALKAYQHSFRVSFDQLLCLPTLRNVEFLWYQQETARKVMKTFRGRAILADEVGLGKTIEAGLIFKEYLLRGLVRSALVLTPSSLVNQWQEELREKFGLDFVSSNDAMFRQDHEKFWAEPFIVASISSARMARHCDAVTSRFFDLVIVDEAHHLRNPKSKTWQLVNAIQKTFFLLLTATPVQNKLEELYSLVTILRPGHLKTRKAFLEEFVTRGKPTDPRNRSKLKELLKEIMVRNTRSVTQLRLPPRFAFTTRVGSGELERAFYDGISSLVSDGARKAVSGVSIMTLRKLLEAAGSSHHAALSMLEKLRTDQDPDTKSRVEELISLGKKIGTSSKTARVLELLRSLPERKIVFVNYLATLHHLREVLDREGIAHSAVYGGLTPAQKHAAIEDFKSRVPVLIGTGIGGEGHNLQFCNIMINYDLPWNPMEIEQRIGRIHRIGQDKEVQVYNFCAQGSIEEHILEVLDRKINMFELVVGEVDMILGHLQDEQEFSDLVFEIWTGNSEQAERQEAFDAFADRLKRARADYQKSKELDEKLFGEDFGV